MDVFDGIIHVIGVGHSFLIGGALVFLLQRIPVFMNGNPVQKIGAVFQKADVPIQVGESRGG